MSTCRTGGLNFLNITFFLAQDQVELRVIILFSSPNSYTNAYATTSKGASGLYKQEVKHVWQDQLEVTIMLKCTSVCLLTILSLALPLMILNTTFLNY